MLGHGGRGAGRGRRGRCWWSREGGTGSRAKGVSKRVTGCAKGVTGCAKGVRHCQWGWLRCHGEGGALLGLLGLLRLLGRALQRPSKGTLLTKAPAKGVCTGEATTSAASAAAVAAAGKRAHVLRGLRGIKCKWVSASACAGRLTWPQGGTAHAKADAVKGKGVRAAPLPPCC